MEQLAQYARIYLLAAGIFLIVLSIFEFSNPVRAFSIWSKWVMHKFFSLHGVVLIVGALPLTLFRDTLTGKIMMMVGLFAVFTGPFILIYPDRIREFFTLAQKEMEEGDSSLMIYIDATFRTLSGILIIFVSRTYPPFQ